MLTCWLCGNKERELAPVLAPGYPEVCERCIGVVIDRSRNLSGPPLVRPENEALEVSPSTQG